MKIRAVSLLSPMSNVQCPKSEALQTNHDFGLWTLDFGPYPCGVCPLAPLNS